jgi:hypothetical protein
MKKPSRCTLVWTLLFCITVPGAAAAAFAQDRERASDREIWHHLSRRLGLTESQQHQLLRVAEEFQSDVAPFLRSLEACTDDARRLRESGASDVDLRRTEQCVVDHLAAIERLYNSFVQQVSRILTREQQSALRQVVHVLLTIFDIVLPF